MTKDHGPSVKNSGGAIGLALHFGSILCAPRGCATSRWTRSLKVRDWSGVKRV